MKTNELDKVLTELRVKFIVGVFDVLHNNNIDAGKYVMDEDLFTIDVPESGNENVEFIVIDANNYTFVINTSEGCAMDICDLNTDDLCYLWECLYYSDNVAEMLTEYK